MENELLRKKSKPVAIWLLAGVFLIIIQIILGGITRLTDSGLSITEWKPILGAMPPTTNQEWNQAFDHYKQIAQFKDLHSYFTLEDFKSIYFWEWLHRLWGRIIGVVFAIPFIIFLIQKRFSKEIVKPMIILFLLGGLQGLIGWVMVQSGLNEENIYVSHIRLAIHFIVALILLVYTFWFALQLLVKQEQKIQNSSSKKFLAVIIVTLILQLTYGAFMAGLKAVNAAPTWPDINGKYVPDNMMSYGGKSYSFFSALINNPIVVQFLHRNLGYLLFMLVVAWTVTVIKEKKSLLFNIIKWLPLLIVIVQVILGIITVLSGPKKLPQHWGIFEWEALAHQFTAMFLLLSVVFTLFLLGKKEKLKSSNEVSHV